MHWRLFVMVVDAASISKGAEQAGITQSGASQAIAQMEQTLGMPLLVRERRQIAVTALGEQVVDQARKMLSAWDAIRTLADESRGFARGRVRLASFPSVISTLLPSLLRSFQQRHPGVELVAVEGTDEEVETWLDEGVVDLGVVLNPMDDRNAVILGHDAWVAAVPANHVLGRRASAQGVSLAELAGQPFVLATGSCRVHGQTLMEQAGLSLSDIRVTVRDWSSAWVLVREGMGVALLPESTLPADQRGVRVMQLVRPIYREFGVLASRNAVDNALVQVVLKHFRDQSPQPVALSYAEGEDGVPL